MLLDEFKVASKPASALQRYNALQRLLRNWADVGTRVFIIVEDVERLGADALAELESMTSADSEDEPGAHLILMGGPKLRKFLKSPTLARLKQRVRRSLILDPFTADETRAYIGHQIHEAGGDVKNLFDDAAIDIVHACSNGIARVINTVCEAMLFQAEDLGAPRVTAALALDVARQDFDYDGDMPDPVAAPKPAATEETPADETEPTFTQTIAEDVAPSLGTTILGDALADLPDEVPPPGVPTDIPGLASSDFDAAGATGEDDIPELIQDTNPGMPAIDPDALLRNARRQPVTTAEELATLREKTDSTQPSLPVLNSPDEPPPPESRTPAEVAAANTLRNAHLEPKTPEPLSKSVDPADSQTIRALDDALRPDTQLLQTLEEPIAPAVDDKPVPLGLRPEIGAKPPSAAPVAPEAPAAPVAPATSGSDAKQPPAAPVANKPDSKPDTPKAPEMPVEAEVAEELPTLSASMRIESDSKDSAADTKAPGPASEANLEAAIESLANTQAKTLVPDVPEAPKQPAEAEPAIAAKPDEISAAPAQPESPLALDIAEDEPEQKQNAATPPGDSMPVAPTLGDDEPTGIPAELTAEAPVRETATDKTSEPKVEPKVEPKDAPTEEPALTLPDDAPTDKVDRDLGANAAVQAKAPAASPMAGKESEPVQKPASQPASEPEPTVAVSGDDNELPDLSLVPEITLDKKLEEHQQEAQAKIDEEAARMVELAAEKEDADEETKAAAAEAAKKREEDEQRKRIESLAARFENAKSIEDVMDDTAAETLFGEEFSQIAAAVTAMHESQPTEASSEASEASNDAANIGAVAESKPAPDVTAAAEPMLELEPEPVAQAQVQQAAPKPTAPTAPPPKPAAPPPQAAKPTMPRPSPAANPNMPDIESSAARRLEMVRALNKKAGKPMPNVPNEPGEEIVLGSDDSSPTCSGPRPEPIENQFGESMTAKLRALSEENIAKMQQQEEEEEKKAKKGGLLSRFRRG